MTSPKAEARDERTSASRLSVLADEDDVQAWLAVAANPSTTWDVLHYMSMDLDSEVRTALLSRTDLRDDVVALLRADPKPQVRAAARWRQGS